MKQHEFTKANLANGLPADYMCGCPKGELLGPCEHASDNGKEAKAEQRRLARAARKLDEIAPSSPGHPAILLSAADKEALAHLAKR